MRLNEQIRVTEVRVIDEDGEMIGVIPTEEAMARATGIEMDLVEIAPNATPPVCRIMDYGKYKYQQQKKRHDQRKRHHGVEMKQIRIKTFRIDPHDLGIKMKRMRSFLEENNRVLISLMFRAREHSHADLGEKLLLEQVAEPLSDVSKIDSRPSKQGRRMTMMLSPLPNVKKIVAARKAREEAAAKRAEREAALQEAASEEVQPVDQRDEPAPASDAAESEERQEE